MCVCVCVCRVCPAEPTVCVCVCVCVSVCLCSSETQPGFHVHCVYCCPRFNGTLYIHVETTQPLAPLMLEGVPGVGVRRKWSVMGG